MKKIVFVFSFLMSVATVCYAQEQVTITTYYPAPVGVYTELRAKRMAIGDNWFDPAAHAWGVQIGANADLVVEGLVGIGTRTPANVGTSVLEVSSGNSGDAYIVIEADEDNSNENDNPILSFRQDADQVNAVIGLAGNNNIPFANARPNAFVIGSESDNPALQFATNDTVRMTINVNGNIGIGITNPVVALDVRNGDTSLCLRVRYTATSGNVSCPTNYYMMYPPGTSAPAPTNYFLCCRGCIDNNQNGFCDCADVDDNEVCD